MNQTVALSSTKMQSAALIPGFRSSQIFWITKLCEAWLGEIGKSWISLGTQKQAQKWSKKKSAKQQQCYQVQTHLIAQWRAGVLHSPIESTCAFWKKIHLGVSKNRGTPKSSILIGFSIITHPFGGTPISGNTHLKHLNIRVSLSEHSTFNIFSTCSTFSRSHFSLSIFPKRHLDGVFPRAAGKVQRFGIQVLNKPP